MAPVQKRKTLPLLAAGLAGLMALSGCATDGAYSGMDVGVGYYGGGGYYDPWYGPAGYGPSGYGYGGWYDDYYYPGNGYYVYDRRGARHRWSDSQRSYWERRREAHRGDRDGNWRDGDRGNRPGWQGRPNGNWQGRPRDGQADAGRGDGRRTWGGTRGQWRNDGAANSGEPQRRSWQGSGAPSAAPPSAPPTVRGEGGNRSWGRGGGRGDGDGGSGAHTGPRYRR